MRIIILNQFFYPDHSATSQLMTELAESLVQRGIEVTAIAARGRYSGGAKLPRREQHNGVLIERAWSTSFGKSSLPARLSDYLSFYIGAIWKLATARRHDMVMALTTPPLIGLVALLVGRLRGMRVVMLIQDVYPDVAVALGSLSARSPLTRILEWLNRFTLKGADRIIVLGERMRDRLAYRAGPDGAGRIDVIHNWADGQLINPALAEPNDFRIAHGLDGKFVVLFSGNLGHVNDFDTVLKAAFLLRERPEILFLFIGDGARAASIKAFAKAHDLASVQLLPYQSRDMTRYSLAAGDASLVTLAQGLAGLSVPSKTYAALAAGRPILFVGDTASEAAKIVADNYCGAVFSSGDAEGLARTIIDWSQNKAALEAMGRRARSCFGRCFEREVAVNAYIETFSKSMASSPRPLLGSAITQQEG